MKLNFKNYILGALILAENGNNAFSDLFRGLFRGDPKEIAPK